MHRVASVPFSFAGTTGLTVAFRWRVLLLLFSTLLSLSAHYFAPTNATLSPEREREKEESRVRCSWISALPYHRAGWLAVLKLALLMFSRIKFRIRWTKRRGKDSTHRLIVFYPAAKRQTAFRSSYLCPLFVSLSVEVPSLSGVGHIYIISYLLY